nr:MAG TPA: hypothetical protein [Caudoviricetes sp.]
MDSFNELLFIFNFIKILYYSQIKRSLIKEKDFYFFYFLSKKA